MGGIAFRAPVMAALFLVVTMALLAMPGSSNFIGEFYILNGVFQEKVVFALVASIAIAMAAYYALRLFQHSMHNRKPDGVESKEIPLARGRDRRRPGRLHRRPGPLPAADPEAERRLRSQTTVERGRRVPRRGRAQMNFQAPDIDYAGLSPVIALTAGICVVLLVGLFRLPRWVVAGEDDRRPRRSPPGSASGSGARTTTWSRARCASTSWRWPRR